MPELPEVETLRRELEKVLLGRIVKSAEILWSKTVQPLTPLDFKRKINGQKIIAVTRNAKILFFDFADGWTLAVHLKMTGQLIFTQGSPLKSRLKGDPLIIVGGHPEDPAKYTRVILFFTDGSELRFNDLRKFGWLRLVSAKDKQILTEKHGLEPLAPEFTLKNFARTLTHYPNRKLKQTLLDQTLIAGLGNIYADESCFAAGVKPNRRLKSLRQKELRSLHRAIKTILRLAIAKGGTSTRNYVRSNGSRGGFFRFLKVYGRGGEPCKRCGTTIRKIKLAGRGTHYCPGCQK